MSSHVKGRAKFYFNMDLLCSTDIEILRCLKSGTPLTPDAATIVCYEDLRNWGFVTMTGGLTEKGQQVLEDFDSALRAI